MDQVFEIDKLRERALAALQAGARPMVAADLASALGVPTWAVVPALESAWRDGLVDWSAESGWTLKPPAAPASQSAAAAELEG